MEPSLRIDVDSRVLVLTMHRPERRNALTREMDAALTRALRAAEDDPAIGAIVLTGTPPAFCAGGDVKNMASADPSTQTIDAQVAAMRERVALPRLLHTIGKPTIAMVRGAAAGAGLSLALACDLRIAATSARFTTAFIKVGLPGDFGGHFFLNRLVGSGRARELYLTAPLLDADQALAIGLVTRVVPDEQVVAETMKLAHAMADGPPIAYRLMKQSLNAAEQASLDETLEVECRNHIAARQTEDHREAARAFAEKRAPRFVGR